jgi:hypothetical protein
MSVLVLKGATENTVGISRLPPLTDSKPSSVSTHLGQIGGGLKMNVVP